MDFTDKVVIVTGASSGIGAATAIEFSALGAKVTITGRNETKLNEVAKQCKNPLVIVGDVTKDDDVKRIVNDTVAHFGKLDILVNNAGMAIPGSFLSENAMEIFDKVMAANLRSSVYLTHLAAPHIIKTKGNIINISSICALIVLSKSSVSYHTAKAALDHFTRSVAAELAPSGVRVNVVNPGPVKSDFAKNCGLNEEQLVVAAENITNRTALGRRSEPTEMADIILFLASDKAKAITGSSFLADNGIFIKA
ncbi:unnamed protein product [Chrysodeixis includens]|uniref:Ketoreductase domain-containing protein n=1 Tax=Chrysodeixis includens TaxID=689277 RepID=A0A9P0BLI5_CHRIL|nr:unnamed protein product [Chrysodeixis includens]